MFSVLLERTRGFSGRVSQMCVDLLQWLIEGPNPSKPGETQGVVCSEKVSGGALQSSLRAASCLLSRRSNLWSCRSRRSCWWTRWTHCAPPRRKQRSQRRKPRRNTGSYGKVDLGGGPTSCRGLRPHFPLPESCNIHEHFLVGTHGFTTLDVHTSAGTLHSISEPRGCHPSLSPTHTHTYMGPSIVAFAPPAQGAFTNACGVRGEG